MFPLAHLGFTSLLSSRNIDLKVLLLGAVLPDLIDKPLGHILLPGNNGRIIAHTLLFSVLLLLIGLAWKSALPLSLGVSMHQLLDSIYLSPESSLWPILGPFPSTDFHISSWLDSLTDPYIIVTELAGLAILIVVFTRSHVGKTK
ncbi:MAG: metal-dependent hydrolase [Thermoplasmata archaeon]|nr:metal-dependent hydrolase [Thermoplasmata archaeon]